MKNDRALNPDRPAWRIWHDEDQPIRIGISSCLLGQKVRYDGGHKHDRYLTGVLGEWVEWVAVCPEVEIGPGSRGPPFGSRGRTGESVWWNPETAWT
jgi:hypothetical protein